MDDLTKAKVAAERLFGEKQKKQEANITRIVKFERGFQQSQLMPLTLGGTRPSPVYTIDSQERNPIE